MLLQTIYRKKKRNIKNILVSLSHTKNIAVANVYVHQHGAEFINIPGVWTAEPEEFAPYVPEWLNRFYITKSFAKFYLDSVPDGHYGPETHKGFAEYLAQILIDRHLIK